MTPSTEGRVLEAIGGVYTVGLAGGPVVEASLRGRLKKSRDPMDRVVVGDRVRLDELDGAWVIESVEPRRSTLVRARMGGRYAKPIAANLDRVVAVMAARTPPPVPEIVDRLLVSASVGGLEGVVVLNKVDEPGAMDVVDRFHDIYGPAGTPVHAVSARTGLGMDALGELLCRGSAILAGPSGVGKSSILRRIDPSLDLRVGALGSRGTGRHTTVSARLIPLACGGSVADTPGFSDAALWGIPREELDHHFPELAELRDGCRFRECLHVHEPECAVQTGVAEGRVHEERYGSYVEFLGELDNAPA